MIRPVLFASAALLLSGAAVAGPTTSFTVTGAVTTPETVSQANLAALPQITEAVTFSAGGAPTSTSFTGPTTWSVLGTAGLAAVPGAKNSSLRDVVVATGSDGYAVAFSGGELNPAFGGGGATPPLVATSQAGAPLGATGFARTTAPRDAAGGRYVSNLANLDVVLAPFRAGSGGGVSSSFVLGGLVSAPTIFTYMTLSALPSLTETASYTAGGTPVTSSFTGVSLWNLIQSAGLLTNAAVRNDELRDYVLVTGSDGYEATVSLGELDPRFGGAKSTDLVAYAADGGGLGANGFARLVVPGDLAGGRYVSNIVSIEVLTAVPEPSTLSLLLGFGLFGVLAQKRRGGAMVLASLLTAGSAWAADGPVRLYAAGSLTTAMTAMLSESGIPGAPVFGPSGVLRARIEASEPADVFASADMAQPRQLAAERGLPVILFARNSLCAFASAALGLTADNVLDRMLDPGVRLATSTPGADPGGDYAWAVFARADAVRPGARALLEGKALKLVGAADSKPLVPGKGQAPGVFLSGSADMMLGYCSGAAGMVADVPGLVSVPLPPALTVGPAYGMVVLTDNPAASRFALLVMSEKGQAVLARFGFRPVATAD